MCRAHWYRLPAAIRSRIWDTYRPGQTIATASPEYLEALRDALAFAAGAEAAEHGEHVAEGAARPVPLSDRPVPCPDGCPHPLTVHSADLGCWLCDCTYGRRAGWGPW
jgi:hypothetical protein